MRVQRKTLLDRVLDLKAAKRWLSIHEHDSADDDLIENEILPAVVELFRLHSGRVVGMQEVTQTYDCWPAAGLCFETRPVKKLCGLWNSKNDADWVAEDAEDWFFDIDSTPPVLRRKCTGLCECGCELTCCSCPTRWKFTYLAGQQGCELSKLDEAWIKSVVAEMYRTREASLETKFMRTAAFERLNAATRKLPSPAII